MPTVALAVWAPGAPPANPGRALRPYFTGLSRCHFNVAGGILCPVPWDLENCCVISVSRQPRLVVCIASMHRNRTSSSAFAMMVNVFQLSLYADPRSPPRSEAQAPATLRTRWPRRDSGWTFRGTPAPAKSHRCTGRPAIRRRSGVSRPSFPARTGTA